MPEEKYRRLLKGQSLETPRHEEFQDGKGQTSSIASKSVSDVSLKMKTPVQRRMRPQGIPQSFKMSPQRKPKKKQFKWKSL